MTRKRITLILTMLVLAVFAIGAVSAADDIATDIEEPTEDIAIDDIAVDDDSVDETVEIQETEQTRDVTYDVDENSNIQDVINTHETTNHIVSFKPIQYNLTNALTIHGNVTLYGNGATLVGSGANIFAIDNADNFTVTGFTIITNSTKAAFYGANVTNAKITYNNITGGKDGINIMQTYDNLTIKGNKITGFTRDGISLVDHRTLSDDEWTNRGNTIVCGNVITGISVNATEVGMFFGGNFKGKICGNVITHVKEGVEFTGKKAKTNGKLSADFCNNNISDIKYGIYMNNHNVTYFNITCCNIGFNSPSILYAIYAPSNYVATGFIGVYNSNFTGNISSRFVTSVGTNHYNNTGFP